MPGLKPLLSLLVEETPLSVEAWNTLWTHVRLANFSSSHCKASTSQGREWRVRTEVRGPHRTPYDFKTNYTSPQLHATWQPRPATRYSRWDYLVRVYEDNRGKSLPDPRTSEMQSLRGVSLFLLLLTHFQFSKYFCVCLTCLRNTLIQWQVSTSPSNSSGQNTAASVSGDPLEQQAKV